MSKSNDRSNPSALDGASASDVEDTDSLPVLSAQRRASAKPTKHAESKGVDSAIAENLDWLVSLITTIDKRLERIEESIEKLQPRLPQEQEEDGILKKIFKYFSRRRIR